MPEVEWNDSPTYRPVAPFDVDPVKIRRDPNESEQIWNPANRMRMYQETFGAGLRLENPVYAAHQLLTRPDFEYDPDFDWNAAAELSEAFKSHSESFLYANSQEEWNFIEQKLAKEQADREMLFSRGTAMGMLAGTVGGMLSPTMLIPLMGPAKGIKGVGQSFALAAIAAGSDELILQAEQDLRTWEETGINIAAGTVLGGLLGSAGVYLRSKERARIINDMETVFRRDEPGPEVFYQTGSMGAASVVQDVGRLKRETLIRPIVRMNPHGRLTTDRGFAPQVNEKGEVQQGVAQEVSPTARRSAIQITDNGLKYEGNVAGVASVPGGSIEHRIPQHNKPLADAIVAYQSSYAKHLSGTDTDPNAIMRTAQNMRGGVKALVPKDKMSAAEFGDAVSEALNTGGFHPDPNVREAAASFRKVTDYVEEINELYYKEAQLTQGESAKRLFTPRKTRVNSMNVGDMETFWHHMYDNDKIQGPDFDEWIQTRIEVGLEKFVQREQQRFLNKVKKFEEDLAAKGVVNTQAYADMLKASRKELAELKKTAKEAKEELAKLPGTQQGSGDTLLQKQITELTEQVELMKHLAEGEDMRGLSSRLIDELYDSIEYLAGSKIRKRGAVGVNLKDGRADFSEVAELMAAQLAHRIRGTTMRVAGADFLQAERGAELARMLNDRYSVKKKFLVTDPELVARSYMRSMAPDLELHRAFGSVNAVRQFEQIGQEYDAFIKRVHDADVETKGPLGRAVNKLTRGKVSKTKPKLSEGATKEIARLQKQRKRALEDFRVLIDRLRHQRGVPEDANAIVYRSGRAIMNANVPLYMGMVLPASVPDGARVLFKAHAKNIIGDGLFRRVANADLYKMQADQLHLAGGALDEVMHTHLNAIMDIYNASLAGGTRFERGIEMAANKTGLLALYEKWTVGQKRLTANIMIGEISRGIRSALEETNIRATDKQVYKEMLASMGLTPQLQRRIWAQMTETPNGGVKNGDNWLPNLEAWDDIEAAMAYKAALAKVAEFDTIITPGVGKPNWMDKNLGWRMLAQFRSFTDASTNKTLLATLQDVNLDVQGIRFLNAVSFSLALGAASYYIRMAATGNEAWETAKNASIGTVMDEAIDRSGLIGWFGEGLRVMDLAAPVQGIHRFGEQGVTRRSSQGAWGMALGPSFGTASKMVDVLQDIDDPTQSTIHRMRQLTFWNQVFWMRRMMNGLENAIADVSGLPESRR